MIEVGDFIKAKDMAYSGIVTGQGTIARDIPCWKIRKPDGSIGVILKRQAVLICKSQEEEEKAWEAQQREEGNR